MVQKYRGKGQQCFKKQLCLFLLTSHCVSGKQTQGWGEAWPSLPWSSDFSFLRGGLGPKVLDCSPSAPPLWDSCLHQRITFHLYELHVLLRYLWCLNLRSSSLEASATSYPSLSPVSPDVFCTGPWPAQTWLPIHCNPTGLTLQAVRTYESPDHTLATLLGNMIEILISKAHFFLFVCLFVLGDFKK